MTSDPDGELFLRAGLRTPEDPAPACWHRTSERVMPWRYDAGGPGEVDGTRLAEVLVATLRAEKVNTVSELVLLRRSEVNWGHFGFFLG
jgi:hypothetical protein